MRKRKAESFFVTAMGYVKRARPDELHWARGIKSFGTMTLKDFLSNYCWVVYTSGFKVSVIEKKFAEIERAFKGFDVEKISRIRSLGPVFRVFRHQKKAASFLKGAMLIRKEGFPKFKERVMKQGVKALEELPGIGRITKKHLARNIGVSDVAKDDVHIRKLVTIFVARA